MSPQHILSSPHCGSQGVAIFEVKEEAGFIAGRDMDHIALVVGEGSYASIKTELERHEVKVEGRSGDPHCLDFNDPDGHRLQILYPPSGEALNAHAAVVEGARCLSIMPAPGHDPWPVCLRMPIAPEHVAEGGGAGDRAPPAVV